jgi:two-component system, NtrC family, sensor kinase
MIDVEDTFARHVLVVDDNPDIFEDFRAILLGPMDTSGLDAFGRELFGDRAKGTVPRDAYTLDYAPQGQAGCEKVVQAKADGTPFSLAFVDMQMPPGWDGLETIEHIWQDDPDIQVVICTAYSDHSWEEITGRLGATDQLLILKKPFDSAEVAQIASALTQKWRLARHAALTIEEMERQVAGRTRDLAQANERLLQMQKMESLSTMAGAIAHNFNNLLMAVLGHHEMALADLPSPSPARSNVEAAERAAREAAELSAVMLTYVGHGKEVMAELDLSAIAHEASVAAGSTQGAHVALEVALPEGLPGVAGDANQLRQMLVNLVVNGAEAIGNAGGTVALRSSVRECDAEYLEQTVLGGGLSPGAYVVVEVSDNGCGMDEETRGRMFDPFFSTKFTGRGLGLAAVFGIVRGHEGTITVYTEPGVGSTIKVLLPARERRAGARPVKTPPPETTWQGSGAVLLIDDEQPILDVGKRLLARLGFTVFVAPDGQKGLEIFRQHADAIVCVLLDMSMPGMSGVQVLEALRELRADVPVVMASGFSEDQLEEQIEGRRLDGFIQKPYQLAQLVETLRTALGE